MRNYVNDLGPEAVKTGPPEETLEKLSRARAGYPWATSAYHLAKELV